MTKLTVEEKYRWLCKKLAVVDVDLWEQDALIELKPKIYFQFSQGDELTVDQAVAWAIHDERSKVPPPLTRNLYLSRSGS